MIKDSTAVNNQKFGIGVIGFNGIVTMKKTTCSENESDGMVFAKHSNDPCLLNRGDILDDDADYLDYANQTDRSNKRPSFKQ